MDIAAKVTSENPNEVAPDYDLSGAPETFMQKKMKGNAMISELLFIFSVSGRQL